jgi:hypothetical protein
VLCIRDRADPFRTTGPGRSGPAGAWARFTDRIDPSDAGTPGPAMRVLPVSDAWGAGASLAARSAAVRPSVEATAQLGDDTEFRSLRQARIDDALLVTRSLLAGARQAAPAGLEPEAASRSEASVLPNPARAHALLTFRARAAGTARVEIMSVSGRRIAEFDQPVEAGAVAIALDSRLPATLAPGAYFARVTAPGVQAVARFNRIAP